MKLIRTIAIVFSLLVIAGSGYSVFAQQVECTGAPVRIKGLTNPNGHMITTKFQFDNPNLQTLLSTTIATGASRTCVVAHLSGLARITDNYVVFQVRIDGVPMEGHTFLPGYFTPVVFRGIDANPQFEDEQYIDPTKVISHNFFTSLPPGIHTIEVLGAAGSNIIPGYEPSVNALVLTLNY